jgi:hypothetical protein
LKSGATAEDIQNVVYEVGRREPFLDQKKKAKDGKPGVSLDWFNLLYQVLLGQEKGPALRVVCRGLRITEHHRYDRRRASAFGLATDSPRRCAQPTKRQTSAGCGRGARR